MDFYGSICISDAAESGQIKKAANGKLYLNISVRERKEVGERGDTHYISCKPKKEEVIDGVRYIIGSLKPSVWEVKQPTTEDINSMPPAGEADLGF